MQSITIVCINPIVLTFSFPIWSITKFIMQMAQVYTLNLTSKWVKCGLVASAHPFLQKTLGGMKYSHIENFLFFRIFYLILHYRIIFQSIFLISRVVYRIELYDQTCSLVALQPCSLAKLLIFLFLKVFKYISAS